MLVKILVKVLIHFLFTFCQLLFTFCPTPLGELEETINKSRKSRKNKRKSTKRERIGTPWGSLGPPRGGTQGSPRGPTPRGGPKGPQGAPTLSRLVGFLAGCLDFPIIFKVFGKKQKLSSIFGILTKSFGFFLFMVFAGP